MNARLVSIGVCLLAMLAPQAAGASTPVRLPAQCLSRSTEPAIAACLRPTFTQAAAQGRVAGTLDALERAVRRGRLDDCHALAHELAHVVVTRVREVQRALALGGTQCSDGYQHGVVEAASADAGPRTCARRRTAELRDACDHALGHRYLMRTGHDVHRALRLCREHLHDHAIERCFDGVLMENSMQFVRLGAALYGLHAPHACDGLRLQGMLRFTCYAEIGEVGMFVFRHRLDPVRRVCARVRNAYGRRACLRGAREELELAGAHG